jgi:hypothetical protein
MSAAGAGVSEIGVQKSSNAMNKATQNEINQQNNYAKQGQQVFQQSLAQSTPGAAQQQIQQGQQQAANSIAQAQQTPLSLSQPSSGGQNNADNTARQGLSNASASNYFGQSNYPLQQYLKDLQANSQLGVIGNQSQQAARNFPTYLQAAGQAGQGLQAAGSLLGSFGGLLGAGLSSAAPAVTSNYMAYPGTASMLNAAKLQSLTPNWGSTFTTGF